VLYCHAHGNRFDIGKEELVAGRPALASPPYAEALAVERAAFRATARDHARHVHGQHHGTVGRGASEPRVAACVDRCCLAEFDALVATEADDLHGEYFFVPDLRREFSAAAINALIAPRPHLSCVGAADPLTPAAGVASIDHALRAAYAESGVPHAWQQRTGRDPR